MQVTGTREAFLRMLSERGVYKKLNVSRSTANNWKRALLGNDTNNMPTIDRMEQLLNLYGAVVVSEKMWELPEIKINIMFTEIKNVVIYSELPTNVRFNQEVIVTYFDDGWRFAGVAYLKRDKTSLIADIKLFKKIAYEKTYPKAVIDNNILHSVLLVNSNKKLEKTVKPLSHRQYKKTLQTN